MRVSQPATSSRVPQMRLRSARRPIGEIKCRHQPASGLIQHVEAKDASSHFFATGSSFDLPWFDVECDSQRDAATCLCDSFHRSQQLSTQLPIPTFLSTRQAGNGKDCHADHHASTVPSDGSHWRVGTRNHCLRAVPRQRAIP